MDDDGWMMGDVGWWHDESQGSWPKKTIGDNMRGTSLSPNVGKGKLGAWTMMTFSEGWLQKPNKFCRFADHIQ